MWVLECPDNTQLLSDEESDKEFSLKYQAWIEDLRSNVTRKLDEEGCSFEDMFRYSRRTVVFADGFRAMLHQEAKEKGTSAARLCPGIH